MDDIELLGGPRVGTRPRQKNRVDDQAVGGLGPGASNALDAHGAVTALFETQYTQLVRLAALLTRDTHRAEELVQDAFVDMHSRWPRLREPGKAAAYLQTSVVNRARSDLRHGKVVRAHAEQTPDHAESAEIGALARVQQSEVMRLLDALPARQRAVLILRYYGQLSEAEIASALNISRGAVKSHSSRGLRALRPSLESRA